MRIYSRQQPARWESEYRFVSKVTRIWVEQDVHTFQVPKLNRVGKMVSLGMAGLDEVRSSLTQWQASIRTIQSATALHDLREVEDQPLRRCA